MANALDNITSACVALGFHGICPEGLEILVSIKGFLSEDTKRDLDEVVTGFRKLFLGDE